MTWDFQPNMTADDISKDTTTIKQQRNQSDSFIKKTMTADALSIFVSESEYLSAIPKGI